MVTGSAAWAAAVAISWVRAARRRSSRVMLRRQGPQLAPGQVLLVSMVLLEDMQPVQCGVGLGQRQDGGVAGRDGFHLGVGELLGADVLGLPDRASPVSTWAMNRALVSRACHI